MPDWEEVRKEYITGDIPLRQLAVKHDVSFNTLKDRVKREGWGESRREYRKQMGIPDVHHKPTTTTTKHRTPQAPRPKYVPSPETRGKVSKIFEASEATLDQVMLKLEHAKSLYELRAAAAALRDIKEIQMIKAALDEEEQIARIAKLRAETKQQEDAVRAEPVEIVFVGRTKEAAQ